MKKTIANLLIKVAEHSVKKASCKTSPWNHFQHNESQAIQNWVKKNSEKL